MADEKQLNAITVFCSKPISQHGKKRKDGTHLHDWVYLVRQIAYFDTGKTCDEATAKKVAAVLRKHKHFPNDSDWSERVNALGAHQTILKLIREQLAEIDGGS